MLTSENFAAKLKQAKLAQLKNLEKLEIEIEKLQPSFHCDYHKNNFVVLGKGPTKGINDSVGPKVYC